MRTPQACRELVEVMLEYAATVLAMPVHRDLLIQIRHDTAVDTLDGPAAVRYITDIIGVQLNRWRIQAIEAQAGTVQQAINQFHDASPGVWTPPPPERARNA